ncbi:hypothetical protein [uncultured Ezakiella sp.]|uniref:hypothetical protein n=1 Tax=uncultured Ezakiella sp. TaxID=1637529 RepID=UPI0025DAE693|nr:hypothetical protein [uncultured Ezakiella sp.]
MRRKLLIILAAFALAFSSFACTKKDDAKEPSTEIEENQKTDENKGEDQAENENPMGGNFVNVDDNDKKEVMDTLNFMGNEEFATVHEKMHEKAKEYQTEDVYELTQNVFKDTGKLSELEALVKQDHEDEEFGKVKFYSGQVKGEDQSLAFDLILTEDGQLIDWRFFPMQDQEKNKEKYANLIKEVEDLANLVENKDYAAIKPKLKLMEMDEEAHKGFEAQLADIADKVSNRKEMKILNITERTAVSSLKDLGITGKIVNISADAIYEEGPEVQYSLVYAEDGTLLSIGIQPKETNPKMGMPQMPEENKTDEENKDESTDGDEK